MNEREMKRRLTLGNDQPLDTPQGQKMRARPPFMLNDVTARMISASTGSVITALVVTPLDVAKVRLQNVVLTNPPRVPLYSTKATSLCPQGCGTLVWKDSVHRNMSSCASLFAQSTESTSTVEVKSTTQMLRKIFAEEGRAGLYRGIRPTLLMAVPNTMMYYTCYDELVQVVRQRLPDHAQSYAPLLSGGAARLLASSATAPLEYLRTREASMAGTQRNASFRHIVKTEGVTTLYRGLASTLWRDVPFSAIYWLVIEELRGVWKHQGGGAPTNVSEQFVQSFVNGLIAGTISACCTTPFDVLKTRQQSANPRAACSHNGATPFVSTRIGTLRALQQLAQSEGVAGLWRGNWARTAKVAPSCAIMISSYEVGKRLLLVES